MKFYLYRNIQTLYCVIILKPWGPHEKNSIFNVLIKIGGINYVYNNDERSRCEWFILVKDSIGANSLPNCTMGLACTKYHLFSPEHCH